jgi:hypothetical protein
MARRNRNNNDRPDLIHSERKASPAVERVTVADRFWFHRRPTRRWMCRPIDPYEMRHLVAVEHGVDLDIPMSVEVFGAPTHVLVIRSPNSPDVRVRFPHYLGEDAIPIEVSRLAQDLAG